MSRSNTTSSSKNFSLQPVVKKWLGEEDLDDQLEDDDEDDDDEDEEDDEPDPEHWDQWVLENMVGETVEIGGVIVDRALFKARFACVSDRCAPGPDRGKWHSCCANAEVGLTTAEVRRLKKHRDSLADYMIQREPRLEELVWPRPDKETPWYLDDDGARLCRPVGRCVFSALSDEGQIFCRLWDYTKKQGIDRNAVQPITCRVFPLILVELQDGTSVLSVLNKRNYGHVGGNSPRDYPCLCDKKLPPIYESMKDDIDWLFGKGFAAELKRVAEGGK